jgi:hypothetical protein
MHWLVGQDTLLNITLGATSRNSNAVATTYSPRHSCKPVHTVLNLHTVPSNGSASFAAVPRVATW